MDEIPEEIILKKMRKYMSTMSQKSGEAPAQQVDPETFVLSKASDDRARELLEKMKLYYPEVYRAIIPELYKLLSSGALKELDGLTVYAIIQRLGLDIRPELRIKFVKDGKEVDLKEYME